MKSAILAATLASAAAFAPSQVAQTSTALNGAFDNEVGAASPWGEYFFCNEIMIMYVFNTTFLYLILIYNSSLVHRILFI